MKMEPYVRVTQYHETDQMGIINHINYIKWLEEARVDFLEKLGYGYEKSVEQGIDFAVLGISCRYSPSMRETETFFVSALRTLPCLVSRQNRKVISVFAIMVRAKIKYSTRRTGTTE